MPHRTPCLILPSRDYVCNVLDAACDTIMLTTSLLLHQVLKFVWSGVFLYNEQPQGYIGLVTGPIAGCLFGGSAAAVQVYWDNVLHKREPHRFPPDLVQALRNFLGGDKPGEEEEPSETSATAAASSVAAGPDPPTAVDPPAADVNRA